MVGSSFSQGMIQFQAFVSNIFIEKIGMVDYFAAEAELWIFIFEGVVTVRTRGQDPFYIIAAKGFYIGLGKDLVQIFIAHASGRISAASFLDTQDGEFDSEMVKDFSKSLGYFLVAVIE